MSVNNQAQIKTVDASSLPVRIGLAAMILVAVVFGWFAVRWQLGNMLAELTLPSDPNAREIAALSKSLAPSDSLTSWLAANTKRSAVAGEDPENPLNDFQQAVRLSPFDYRWWIELARAYEQAEKEQAEQAYLKAVEISPAYTYPRWQLGNFYLRQNRSDEAFAELKNAAQKSPVYRQQVFSLVWDFYEQDSARLEQIAGDSPDVRIGLVHFYATKGRAEDSLRIWNTLSEKEKKENQAMGKIVAQALFDRGFYRSAIEFVSQLGIEPKAKPAAVQNGGFEDSISYTDYIYFGWQISPTEKMEVNLDAAQKREGNRSLRVTFNGYSNPQLGAIYQTIVTNPGENYVLSFWLKTENLKSAGTPVLDILDKRDNKIIATSKPFPIGTNDWQEVKIEFTAPAATEAVYLRTARVFCGDACPLVGTFWYDDFRLVKK